jgi:hypothetical protein
MQTQPKPEQRLARATRARQARGSADDTFTGGTMVRAKLRLTRPWMIGTERLWSGRRPRVERE